MPKLAKEKDCTGCLACIDACKHQAIKIKKKNGHNYVNIIENKCIDCKLCEKSCPIINPINKNESSPISVYGGWCKDIDYRKKSASGGAFSALALDTLGNNGIVIGAALDNNSVKHIIVSNKNELLKVQNSKYIQSDTLGIYSQTKQLLKDGKRVLFSGTPCQIAGLNSFLRKEYDNLITVDLICDGIPSKDTIRIFSDQRNVFKIISFRNKKYGWNSLSSRSLTWINKKNEVIIEKNEDDIFYNIFSSSLSHRRICCHCPFSKIPRQADITVADFWGIKRFESEWNNGISLIIANNNKGKKTLKDSKNLILFDSSLKECIYANPRLINGKKYHEYHPIMLFPSIKNVIPENIYIKIIQNKMPYKLLWAPFKILTILSNKRKIKLLLKNEKDRYNNNIQSK